MAEVTCPRCGATTAELQNLEGPLLEKLREAGNEDLPSQVCPSCFTQLAGSIARGSVLMAREKAKEQKKVTLWKSRVNLIKKARSCMGQKAFSDAAVAYEKYIKVLEMVFEAEAGGLTPEHFKDSARTQELTVVASAYWDLIRIYDTSKQYGDRQLQAAKKLAVFLKFTPIYPDIIRKAEIFSKQAKNPDAIKGFLKMAQEQKGRCFIATSAFESEFAPEVIWLQVYRDEVLSHHATGRAFIRAYYRISPPVARFLDNNPLLKPLARMILRELRKFLALCQ